MAILSPILITLLVCVIYAWAFQAWPPGWGPLAAFVLLMLLSAAGVVYYLKKFADEEEREQFNVVTFLPTGVAIFFALLMTMAWWLSPLRAGATRIAAMHSAQPVEVALSDADPTVRKHACLELTRLGAQKTSHKLYESFNAHPSDVPACVKDLNKRDIGQGRYIVEEVTRQWTRPMRRMRSEAEADFVCKVAKSLGEAQIAAGVSEKGSPELLECALTGRFAKARTCCAEAFGESYPEGISTQTSEDLYIRGVSPVIYAKMARVTFDAKDLDASEATMGQQLALAGKEEQLIELGCEMFGSDRPDIRQSALMGMNHIAAQLSCARLGEGNEGAMLHLTSEDVWTDICDDMFAQDAKTKLTDRMCHSLESSWEEAAFIEAQNQVMIAIQRAQFRRLASTVSTSREKRGYGVSGSSGARKQAYGELDRRLNGGASVFSLTRGDIRRASGQERNRDSCISFARGNQNGGAKNDFMDEEGIWCGRSTDSLSEIMARRKAAFDAVKGKGTLNVGEQALRDRYGGAAVDAASQKMRETYREGSKNSVKK